MTKTLRIISMLLSCMLILGILPVSVFAAGNQHTVTIDPNNPMGTTTTVIVEDGECLAEPDVPKSDAFRKFLFWSAEKKNGEAFDFNTPITSDMTLYAQWETDSDMLRMLLAAANEDEDKEEVVEETPDVDTYEQLLMKQGEELTEIKQLNGGELPEMYLDTNDAIPSAIVGTFSNEIVTDYDSAIEALSDVQSIMMFEDVEAEFEGEAVQTYGGFTQFRLQQMYNGVEVYGKQLIVTTDDTGLTTSLTGDYDPLDDVMDETINLSVEEAYEYAVDVCANVDPNGQLVVFTVDEGYNEYAYRFSGSDEVFISAIDGSVLLSFSNILSSSSTEHRVTDYIATIGRGQEQAGGHTYTIDTVYDNDTEQYVFFDSTRNIYYMDAENMDYENWNDYYYLDFQTDDDNIWNDSILKSVTLYDNLSDVYDFYVDNLGIHSYDNNGGEIRAYVNDGADNGRNAYNHGPYWTALDGNKHVTQLRFGGNANMQEQIDVVAHEFTHSVQHSLVSGIGYFEEIGALMEGYSDFMGELVELDNGHTNWYHGVSGGRNLADPLSNDCPEKYKGSKWTTRNETDQEKDTFAHHNSTVISHALYNIYSYGLNDVSELSELLYRAWGKLSATATFADYYIALLTASHEMNLSDTEREYITRAFENADIVADEYKANSIIGKWVTFEVKDSNGEAIPNAVVKISNVTNLRTDENGICRIKIKKSQYSVEIIAANYKEYKATINVQDEMTYTAILIEETAPDSEYVDSFELSGRVSDSQTDNAVSDVEIQLRKGDGVTSGRVVATTTTDSNGIYIFTGLESGYYTAFISKSGYISHYETVIVRNTNMPDVYNTYDFIISMALENDEQLRFVLSWGLNPRDIDSHILGETVDGTPFHVYYIDKQATDSAGNIVANLDIDDVDSYGPETTTLNWDENITYDFYIHLYAGTGTLSSSGANIKIYSGSTLLHDINVPSGSENMRWWKVCSIRNGQITLIDTFKNNLD